MERLKVGELMLSMAKKVGGFRARAGITANNTVRIWTADG